jgi:hypothetical protein
MCLRIDDSWMKEVSPTYADAITEAYEDSIIPEVTFETALEMLASIEPDAPEFDIKPFDRVLFRDMNSDWSANFYNKIYGDSGFDFVACQAEQMIKYDGNEHLHGTTNTPAGWWECENRKPVWRTK